MSPAGIGLIAFVVFVSGLLAYYGDVIGRKMGKKRLHVGRLRPRHVAAITTAVFGMIGALLAIGALLYFSTPVRVMLLEGDKLRAQIGQLERDRSRLSNDIRQAQDQVGIEKANVVKEKAKLLIAQKDVSGLKKLSDTLRRQVLKVRVEVMRARREIGALKPQIAALKAQKSSLETQNKGLAKYNSTLAEQNTRLGIQLAESEKTLEKNRKDILELKKTISDLQKQLSDQAEDAGKQLRELRDQVDLAKSDLDKARGDLDATTGEYNRLKGELERIIKGPTAVSRTQPLIFARGDELARIPARTLLNNTEAKSYLLALLDNSASYAKSKGAKPGASGGEEAVLAAMQDKTGEVSAEQQMLNLTEKLAGKNQEQVALAYAFFNSFLGEPVPVVVQIRPNPVVYRTGQVVAETRVDGQATEDRILATVSGFVGDTLAPKAVKDGLIPAVGRAEPLGEISPDAILGLVADIKRANRVLRVQFVAAQDTRAADRLKLRFVLK